MKIFLARSLRRLGFFLSAVAFFARPASAGLIIVAPAVHKPKTKHAPQWTAPGDAPAAEVDASNEQPITIDTEAPPSASLQPFLESHLDKALAPLGSPAFTQPDLVAGIRDAYAKALTETPDARKPAYQQAMQVCGLLIDAIGERQKAVDALNKSYENRRSESVQPRGGKKEVQATNQDEAFFYDGQKNNWKQAAAALHQRIVMAYQRERATETQAGDWPLPKPAATPTPAVAAPAGTDPVIGNWKLEGYSAITLTTDNQITGAQQGTWRYTCTTDAGRNYELHLGNKGWVDYMVLTSDGNTLDGKTKKNKHIGAWRS